jgi:hypothetical protein
LPEVYTTGLSPHSVATILVAYNLEKQKTILKYCKTSFISIRKEFVGIKTAFCPQPNQHTISIIPEMKSKSDSNSIAGKWI